MQRLRYVSQEMYQEFHSLFSVLGTEGSVSHAGGVVGDGADDAAGRFAVAGQVHTAGGWGRIKCVDEAVKTYVRLCERANEGGKRRTDMER
jgi:hypothetical protein